MEKRFALGSYGSQLWTREKAREIRTEMIQQAAGLDVGDVLVIDAKGVEVFDYSFANEFFGKSLLSMPIEYPGRFLAVEHLTAYARENLSKALEALNLSIIERRKGKPGLLGKVHPADDETFAAVVSAKNAVSATELSKRLNVNLTAMNERLAKLTSAGLVRREKGASTAGREQYQYLALG